jgi:hypothetical protein
MAPYALTGNQQWLLVLALQVPGLRVVTDTAPNIHCTTAAS